VQIDEHLDRRGLGSRDLAHWRACLACSFVLVASVWNLGLAFLGFILLTRPISFGTEQCCSTKSTYNCNPDAGATHGVARMNR
jgi:hypothetical protein